MKKFNVTQSAEPIEFEIGDDKFTAVAPDSLPANILMRYSEQVGSGHFLKAHEAFFGRVLDKESASLFTHRLDSKDNPITVSVMNEVAEWLIGQYAGVPTKRARR